MKKTNHILNIILIVILFSTLIGCGGGDGSSDSSIIKEGQFLDSAVWGLQYSSGNQSGITDPNGIFKYEQGEKIKFTIGDIVLGETDGKPIITPVNLVTNGSLSHQKVINISRLLLTLDLNGDPNDGIEIPEEARADAKGVSIVFDVPETEFNISALLDKLLYNSNLVSSEDAKNHLQETLSQLQLWVLVTSDNFNDNNLNPTIWSTIGNKPIDPSRYATETNGRLEFRIDGTEDDTAAIRMITTIPVEQDFRVQVDFDSSECSTNSMILLGVHNATTDIDRFDQCIIIGNGYLTESGRCWFASKVFEHSDSGTPEESTQSTSVSSGTLYIEHTGSLFYVSFTGYGQNNAFAIYTINDWTNCSEVYISLECWSGNEVLSGQGSYVDNFKQYISAVPL